MQTSNSKVAENWNGHVKTLPQVGTSVAQPRGDHRRQLLALALRLSRQPARCNTYPASSVLQLQHRKQLHLRRPQYRSRSVSAVGETVAAGSLRRGKSNCIAAFPTASVGCYARIADCMYSTPSTVRCEVGCSAPRPQWHRSVGLWYDMAGHNADPDSGRDNGSCLGTACWSRGRDRRGKARNGDARTRGFAATSRLLASLALAPLVRQSAPAGRSFGGGGEGRRKPPWR